MSGEPERRRDSKAPAKAGLPARFGRQVLLVYGLGVLTATLFAIFWFIPQVLLLAFAAILLAVLLRDACAFAQHWLRVPRRAALATVLLMAIGVFGLGGALLAPQIVEQASALADEMPRGLERLRTMIAQHPELHRLASRLPSAGQVLADTALLFDRARTVFSGLLGVLGNTVIVLFLSIYLAAQPTVYTEGVLKVLPPGSRPRARFVLYELGRTLSLWLRGKLLSMVAVGLATAVGLSVLDVRLAVALGTLTGLLGFIPYLGPILAAIPAMLIAFAQGPLPVLYVALLFLGIQVLEGYLLMPLVERRTVSLPPALTIIMQVTMGLAFGLVGVALATPMTAVIAVLIATLYVQDVLHDEVTLPTDVH